MIRKCLLDFLTPQYTPDGGVYYRCTNGGNNYAVAIDITEASSVEQVILQTYKAYLSLGPYCQSCPMNSTSESQCGQCAENIGDPSLS